MYLKTMFKVQKISEGKNTKMPEANKGKPILLLKNRACDSKKFLFLNNNNKKADC